MTYNGFRKGLDTRVIMVVLPKKMIKQSEWQEIFNFIDLGLSVSEVSRQTGRCRATIKKLIAQGGPVENLHILHTPSLIQPFEKYLRTSIKRGISNRTKLLLEIKERGYKGSYSTLNNYLGEHFRSLNCKGYRRSAHLETGPGEQAQVDWGTFGKIEIGGKKERLYAFVYVLGYSRALYIEFTIKQNLKTLEMCHIRAFEKFGIPKTLVYDNMKTVVLRRERLPGGESIPHYNPAFYDFSRYYGFEIFACPPYWPRAKGKVESGVKYVRNNFMQGMKFNRGFSSLQELNEKAKVWLDSVANVRDHKSTGRKPFEMWLEEKAYLRFPTELPSYPVSSFVVRHSTKDALINFKFNYYSVPMQYARKKLYVKEVNSGGIISIEIYCEDTLIAAHSLSSGRGKWIVDKNHIITTVPRVKFTKKLIRRKAKNLNSKLPFVVYARGLSYYSKIRSGVKKHK